jgi:hypothetical protein
VTTAKEHAAMDYFNELAERCQWCGIKRLGAIETQMAPGHYLRTCQQCRGRLAAKRLIKKQ